MNMFPITRESETKMYWKETSQKNKYLRIGASTYQTPRGLCWSIYFFWNCCSMAIFWTLLHQCVMNIPFQGKTSWYQWLNHHMMLLMMALLQCHLLAQPQNLCLFPLFRVLTILQAKQYPNKRWESQFTELERFRSLHLWCETWFMIGHYCIVWSI